MFDIQSKYKKLILTDISMKLALYFHILCGYSFITELMLGGKRRCFKVSVWYWKKQQNKTKNKKKNKKKKQT